MFTTYCDMTLFFLNMPSVAAQLYIEGYLQAMLDVMYKQEYLRVRVIDDLVTSLCLFAFALYTLHVLIIVGTLPFQVFLKNLPPNSALINEIVENVKAFLVSKALLKGDASTVRSWRRLRNEPVSFFLTLNR